MIAKQLHLAMVLAGSMIVSQAAQAALLGINWLQSRLFTFDPDTATPYTTYAQLPSEKFLGLAYVPSANLLYAAAQGTRNLYSIDPHTFETTLIGAMAAPLDVSGLTYDPITDTLYTTLGNGGGPALYSVDRTTAALTHLVSMPGLIVDGLSYNADDQQLYAIASNPLETSSTADVIRIDPVTLTVTELFQTPYNTAIGFAKKPGSNVFYTWVNDEDGNYYATVDVGTQELTLVSTITDQNVEVTSLANIYLNFPLGDSIFVPPSVPIPAPMWLLSTALLGLFSLRHCMTRQLAAGHRSVSDEIGVRYEGA